MKPEPYDIAKDNEATDLFSCPYYSGVPDGVGWCKLAETRCAKELGEECYEYEEHET